MRNVYYRVPKIALDNDKDYQYMNIGGIVYVDDSMTKAPVTVYKSFPALWEAASNKLCEAYTGTTPFRKRRFVEIRTIYGAIRVYEDSFQPVFTTIEYCPMPDSISLHSLMKQLPAHDFLDYLKDRGVNIGGLLEDKSV